MNPSLRHSATILWQPALLSAAPWPCPGFAALGIGTDAVCATAPAARAKHAINSKIVWIVRRTIVGFLRLAVGMVTSFTIQDAVKIQRQIQTRKYLGFG